MDQIRPGKPAEAAAAGATQTDGAGASGADEEAAKLVYFPFAIGRSTRSSRNSVWPLMSRRRPCDHSSGGAEGSIILSIAFAASSLARAARAPDGCLAFVMIASPSSTR